MTLGGAVTRLLGAWAVLALALTWTLNGQPRLAAGPASSYTPGDTVEEETILYDSGLRARRLGDIVRTDTRVVVLFLFGGAAPTAPDYHPLRGGIWCPDSFDEFPILRAAMRHFKGKPVQFIPVAVPPAYSDVYGFEKDVFISRPDGDPLLDSQARLFVDLTEKLRETDVLPFADVFYDPKYRLADDPKRRPHDGSFGKVYDWQGKLRWREDPRKYGTPTIWILSGDLKVIGEPLTGNNYNDDPPQIRYGYEELRQALESALAK